MNKISADACSGKEEVMNSRVSRFSRGKLEAGRNKLGLGTARDESKSYCCFFKA